MAPSQPDVALSGSVIATIVIFASLLFLFLLFFTVRYIFIARRARRAAARRRRQMRDPERGRIASADRHELHELLPVVPAPAAHSRLSTQQQEEAGATDVAFRPAAVRASRPRSMPAYQADTPLPALPRAAVVARERRRVPLAPTVVLERAGPVGRTTPEQPVFEVGEDEEAESEEAASGPGSWSRR
ncbi:hypothetical protein NpNSSI1_00000192 [Neofusicoccum parvum]|nr:hypothetical protein NpNSSI1_00000192 [Neofusicoccum parvum]